MQIVLCINSSSFNKWLNNDFALNAVTYMYSRILVYIVHVYAYQLFIYTMWIISLTIFLLPHLDKFPSTFWWCKSALYVFAVAGLSHISSHCSLLSPARIAVKSTEPSNVILEIQKVVNNHDICSWTSPFFQQNSISQCYFMKCLCVFLTPSISGMERGQSFFSLQLQLFSVEGVLLVSRIFLSCFLIMVCKLSVQL